MSHATTESAAPAGPRFRRLMSGMKKDVQGDGGKYPLYKVKDDGNDHAIRILPGNFGVPEGGEFAGKWYVPVVQHWFPNPKSTNGFSKSVFCKRNQQLRGEDVGGDCPFCEAWDQLREKSDTLAAEILEAGKNSPQAAALKVELEKVKLKIKACSYRTTYLVNLLDREESNKGKICYLAQTAFEQLIGQYGTHYDEQAGGMADDGAIAHIMKALEKDPENPKLNQEAFDYCDAFSIERGYDVLISRKTDKGQTKYSTQIKRRPSPFLGTREETDAAVKAAIDLEKLVAEAMAEEPVEEIETYVQHALDEAGKKKLTGEGAGNLDFGNRGNRGTPPSDKLRDQPDPSPSEYAAAAEGYEPEEGTLAPEDQEYVDPSPPPAAQVTPTPAAASATGKPSSSRSSARAFKI